MDGRSQSECNEEDSFVVSLEKDVCEPMLSTEEAENDKWTKDKIDNKLIHLDKRARDETCDTLEHSETIECSLYDMKSANVPTKHFFELTDNRPIYHCL